MKKLSGAVLALLVLTLAETALSQSLADAAKTAKQDKKQAAKVYTNEDLPSVPASKMAEQSNAGEATATNAEAAAASDSAKPEADAKPAPEKADPDSAKKAGDEAQDLKSKISDQEEQVKSLEHEIDLMQRENRLKQASFYGDAGNQLRDQKQWADAQRAYQSDLDSKQKELAEAKQKLDDIREQARKSGMKTSE